MKYLLLYIILFPFLFAQEIFTEYLIEDSDTTDVFSYQIPSGYNPLNKHPMIITFHQWGGNENSNYYTLFDEEANIRNWILLSPFGGSANNYNHQGMQDMVEKELLWMIDNYNINKDKIYMVGGSMGGATGAIYANNHLDPTKPMVAATASASGILDCERRAIEMDGNNSMIEWFGGNWDEVPFEYHRNSAVYFADSTQSMHYNLQHTPLYLDFGVTEPHRTHAEDLYELLNGYNQNMWIDVNPTGSHGYSVFDENHVCNWLDQFELIKDPLNIKVNLDEPSRAYWAEAHNQYLENQFINMQLKYEYTQNDTLNKHSIYIEKYTNSDSLILHIIEDKFLDENYLSIRFKIESEELINLGFSGSILNNYEIDNITGSYIYLDNTNPLPCGIEYIINEDNIIWINNYTLTENNPCFENNFSINNDTTLFIDFNFSENEANDINGDGRWDVLDIVLVINHIFQLNILNIQQQINADFNQDEIINILDVVLIVNLILDI